MAICNRDLASSEQTHEISANYGLVATSLTLPIGIVPYPANIVSARVSAKGLSNAPTGSLRIQRFIVGSGATAYLGAFTTLTLVDAGTSGILAPVQAAAGSTALSLLAGDVITYVSAGSNSAVDSLSVAVVVQATQDIRSWFGA